MLPNARLLASLDMLEHYYQRVASPLPPPAPREPGEPAQFCKYAALELCGWIEEAQDYIVLQFGAKLTEAKFKKSLEEVVRGNYGFDLEKHFLPMMAFGIGIANYETIVKSFGGTVGGNFSGMEGLLGSGVYKALRNRHAHTHFDETAPDKLQHLNSPAVVKQHAKLIFDGLEELFNRLKLDGLL